MIALLWGTWRCSSVCNYDFVYIPIQTILLMWRLITPSRFNFPQKMFVETIPGLKT